MRRRLDIALGLVHRPTGPLPRRADHRARSRGTRADVGRGRPIAAGRGAHDPADDALPRRSRRARRPPRDRQPRPDRRRGSADGAEGAAPRRRGAHRAGERRDRQRTASRRAPRRRSRERRRRSSAGVAGAETAAAPCQESCRPWSRRGSRSRRSASPGPHSTTSISTTPAASSQPRIEERPDAHRRPHLVHGRDARPGT